MPPFSACLVTETVVLLRHLYVCLHLIWISPPEILSWIVTAVSPGRYKQGILIVYFNYTESKKKTRAVRGSDYSPTTVLSEEQDKLVTENWNDREKKISKDYTKTTCTSSFHAENICKVSKQLMQNCKRCCTHKVPTVYSL